MEMEKKIKALERENTKMKMKLKEFHNLDNSVKKIYTSGQIKKLKNPNKNLNWSLDDISAAICLHISFLDAGFILD